MTHSRLFVLELKKDITVAEKIGNASLNLSFRRLPRSGVKDEQYKNLVSITSDVLLPQMLDHWSWSLNASGDFIIRSVRNHMDDVLLPKFDVPTRWLILCPLCNMAVETTSHIFFSFSLSRHIMHKICRWWDLDISSFKSYVEWFNWLSNARIAKCKKEILEGICYVSWWYEPFEAFEMALEGSPLETRDERCKMHGDMVAASGNIICETSESRMSSLRLCPCTEKHALGEVSYELLDTQVNPTVWEA
ncbi:hypothetical protein Tco_0246471 [Tanacetum coccineum]